MGNVRSYLDKMISKELTRSGVFHTLLRAYLEHARIAQVCVCMRGGKRGHTHAERESYFGVHN